MKTSGRRPAGFEEDASGYQAGPAEETPFAFSKLAQTRLAEGGRLVIPADMRAAMNIKPGDTIVLELEDDVLTVLTPAAAIRQVQKRLAPYRKPGRSVVDEFLADKRAEVAREDEEAKDWLAARRRGAAAEG